MLLITSDIEKSVSKTSSSDATMMHLFPCAFIFVLLCGKINSACYFNHVLRCIFLTVGGIVRGDENVDLDFGECLLLEPSDEVFNCPMLNIECQDQTGFILSPDFPFKVKNESLFGKV